MNILFMGLRYATFHWIIHLSIIISIYFIFRLDIFGLLLVLLANLLIDLDHYHLITKHGIRGTICLRTVKELGKPRKYYLHNILVLIVASLGSSLIFNQQFFPVGIFLLAVSTHLFWDFFEDVAIFGMGIKHWKT